MTTTRATTNWTAPCGPRAPRTGLPSPLPAPPTPWPPTHRPRHPAPPPPGPTTPPRTRPRPLR
ncbi:hypothetical protein B7767_40555, partial [Streptomyces sp. 13-12-16]